MKKPRRRFVSPAFELVYEDNFLLVVNKNAGFLSVPTGDWKHDRRGSITLIGEIRRYLSIKSGRELGATPIHRLDRDTSGLLVIAKSQKIAARIKEEFKARKPEREYQSIVIGKFKNSSGTFESHLATDSDLNQYSTDDEDSGKLAITHYKTVEVFPDTSRIQVTLETGRRNQIRVHFAEAGHPILGDVRYESEKARHPDWPYPRLALHAAKLGFNHPMLRKKLRFEAELPQEFQRFFKMQENIKLGLPKENLVSKDKKSFPSPKRSPQDVPENPGQKREDGRKLGPKSQTRKSQTRKSQTQKNAARKTLQPTSRKKPRKNS